ncbi:30S ribosomal protein S17e [Candidatus Micrarchaeota archaeon]|nr:30S ribosomal protein S17e [Candidatus Micrarchaeota archaeon]MBU1930790.1 30S ribosomal protein S17e [Candidatus Micrarchaeota archaeon]
MGKALLKGLRTKADLLLQEAPEKFGTDFEKNKRALTELGIPFAKINRNLIAGYMARKLEQKKD